MSKASIAAMHSSCEISVEMQDPPGHMHVFWQVPNPDLAVGEVAEPSSKETRRKRLHDK